MGWNVAAYGKGLILKGPSFGRAARPEEAARKLGQVVDDAGAMLTGANGNTAGTVITEGNKSSTGSGGRNVINPIQANGMPVLWALFTGKFWRALWNALTGGPVKELSWNWTNRPRVEADRYSRVETKR